MGGACIPQPVGRPDKFFNFLNIVVKILFFPVWITLKLCSEGMQMLYQLKTEESVISALSMVQHTDTVKRKIVRTDPAYRGVLVLAWSRA
jgi:hypothetical protein